MGYFPVRNDSRVVIYERKMFKRLSTGEPVNSYFKAFCLQAVRPDGYIFIQYLAIVKREICQKPKIIYQSSFNILPNTK